MSRYDVTGMVEMLKSFKLDSERLAAFKSAVDAGRCCLVSNYDRDWVPLSKTFVEHRDTAWQYMVNSKQFKKDEEKRREPQARVDGMVVAMLQVIKTQADEDRKAETLPVDDPSYPNAWQEHCRRTRYKEIYEIRDQFLRQFSLELCCGHGDIHGVHEKAIFYTLMRRHQELSDRELLHLFRMTQAFERQHPLCLDVQSVSCILTHMRFVVCFRSRRKNQDQGCPTCDDPGGARQTGREGTNKGREGLPHRIQQTF